MDNRILSLVENNFPLLYELDLKKEISEKSTLMEVPRGTILMDIGSYIKSVPLVVEGTIKIIREDDEGNELLMYFLNSGSTCAMSLTCCMREKTSEIRAIAEEDCIILLIPVDLIDVWLKKYSSWKSYIMETYQHRFEELLQTIDSIAFMNLDERLVKYLKDKSKSLGSSSLNTTHQDVAYDLNSSREVISRLLKILESKGMVRLSRNNIEILDLL